MSEVIRTTVPVRPEVHAAFKRLADVQGVSLGRAIGDWLGYVRGCGDGDGQDAEGQD